MRIITWLRREIIGSRVQRNFTFHLISKVTRLIVFLVFDSFCRWENIIHLLLEILKKVEEKNLQENRIRIFDAQRSTLYCFLNLSFNKVGGFKKKKWKLQKLSAVCIKRFFNETKTYIKARFFLRRVVVAQVKTYK